MSIFVKRTERTIHVDGKDVAIDVLADHDGTEFEAFAPPYGGGGYVGFDQLHLVSGVDGEVTIADEKLAHATYQRCESAGRSVSLLAFDPSRDVYAFDMSSL